MYQEPAVRQLHSTSDCERIYAVPDVRDAYVVWQDNGKMWCGTCTSSRCEHVDMVAAYRRQNAHNAHQMPVAARRAV